MPQAKRRTHTHTISVTQLMRMFPTEDSCYAWLEKVRWDGQPQCPHCEGTEGIGSPPPSKPHHYWCKPCRKHFTVTTKTCMHSRRKDLRDWIYVLYSVMTARKSVSAMQLSKELSVQYRTAWYMMHRIREACGRGDFRLANTVEVDETYVGGKERNKHASKRLNAGRGTIGKTAVVGIRERGGKMTAAPVERINTDTMVGFIEKAVEPGSQVFTDSASAYRNLNAKYKHEAVAHSAGEYVRGLVHTNGIESAWSLLKRAIHGTWHHVSPKHLGRYVNEVAFRLNEGNVDTDILERMEAWMRQMSGKRISYESLIADNGLSNEVAGA